MDSLVKSTVADIQKNNPKSVAIANIFWDEGSRFSRNKYKSTDNFFEIYILFSINKKYYTQKIDNYSFFKKRRRRNKSAEDYLTRFYESMKNEQLNPKTDTVFGENGERTISITRSDDEPVRMIRIFKTNDTLAYDFPNYYSKNLNNLDTHRFMFFDVLENSKFTFNKRKQKRISVFRVAK